jgi:hypothetical protein
MKKVLVLKFIDGGWVGLGLGKAKEGYSEESLIDFLWWLKENGIDYEIKKIEQKMERWRGDDYFSTSPDLEDDEFDIF